MGFWAGVGNALSSPAGQSAMSGGFGLLTPSLNDRNNRRNAKRAREYNERMANTAHQRQVKDMKLAGLNPILSVSQGGAASPNAPLEPSSGYENSGKDVIKDFNLAKRVKQELVTASKENAIQDQELINRKETQNLIRQQTQKAIFDAEVGSATAYNIGLRNVKENALAEFYKGNPSFAVAHEFGVDAGLVPKLLDSVFGKFFPKGKK